FVSCDFINVVVMHSGANSSVAGTHLERSRALLPLADHRRRCPDAASVAPDLFTYFAFCPSLPERSEPRARRAIDCCTIRSHTSYTRKFPGKGTRNFTSSANHKTDRRLLSSTSFPSYSQGCAVRSKLWPGGRNTSQNSTRPEAGAVCGALVVQGPVSPGAR